jgi:hypothetical protein
MKPYGGGLYLSSPNVWKEPFKWQRAMEKSKEAQRVFTCSLSDFFHAKADKLVVPEGYGKYSDWKWRDAA